MLIETNPGSRLRECDNCGTMWLENFPGDIHPRCIKEVKEFLHELCPECKERWERFVRLHLKRSLWSEYGVEVVR